MLLANRLRFVGCLTLCAILATALMTLPVFSDDPSDSDPIAGSKVPFDPEIEPASDQGEKAMAGFQLDKRYRAELFAAEPMLANPTAFGVDDQGRFYVVESFRHGNTPETTNSDDDLACRTVEDRIAMHKRKHGDAWRDYTIRHERVRLLEDTDGDHRADRSTVFADGFNNIETGLAAGVLPMDGGVYFTNIPHLWYLKDTDGDGKADERRSLSKGYGVHVGYRGHDMHGPLLYVDGKVYWTIGDRGFNVPLPDGTRLENADRGAVLRCNPDGSELEIYHNGLRNPQDLTFDEYGNLFTGDNNSDAGDQARVVHVVEGGDSGWHIGWQYMGEQDYQRGPWNAEKIWHPQFAGQGAWFLPPITWLGNGPAGVTFYPGTGLNDDYRGHMFMCDYRGGPGQCGIYAFRFVPNGASYQLDNLHKFMWGVSCSDVGFGYDGLYILDWAGAWNAANKGRLYRFYDPETVDSEPVTSTRDLIRAGMNHRTPEELANLLAHRDQRVRLAAQLALTKKDSPGKQALRGVALEGRKELARLHAIWGLGIVARQDSTALDGIVSLLGDTNAEVRAQTAKVMGDGRHAAALGGLVKLLGDTSPRVRMLAATALGKLKDPTAVEPLLKVLRENKDQDPYVRHGAVMGLVGSASPEQLAQYVDHPDHGVRMGVLLAMRRRSDPEIAAFFYDSDEAIVTEAARAVNDVPIPAATGALAGLIDPFIDQAKGEAKASVPGDEAEELSRTNEPLLRRVLNANYRLGGDEQARKLVLFAADPQNSGPMKREAMSILGDWESTGPRDRVVNLQRPVKTRELTAVKRYLTEHLTKILNNAPDDIQQDAIRLVRQFQIPGSDDVFADWVRDVDSPTDTRIESLKLLADRADPRVEELVDFALTDKDPKVRVAAGRALAQRNPTRALMLLTPVVFESESLVERQKSIATLGSIQHDKVDKAFADWLDMLLQGEFEAALHLDLLTAAEQRSSEVVKRKLAEYQGTLDADDPLAPYRVALEGGDGWRGRLIFVGHMKTKCLRCHKVRGTGGSAGPDLTFVGKEKTREYLLESIVHPNAQIARGFETVIIVTVDGRVLSGIVQEENDEMLRLREPDGDEVVIPLDEIDERDVGPSGMPGEMGKVLDKFDLRDLVQFLSTLRHPKKAE